MTQDPNPYATPYHDPSRGYAYPGVGIPPVRPTSVTVIAIIGIILGSLGILCDLFGAAMNGVTAANGGRSPLPNQPATGVGVAAYNAAASFVMLLLAILLVVGCAFALKLRPWARKAVIAYALIMIVLAMIHTGVQIAWVGPAMVAAMRQSQPNNPAVAMVGTFGTVSAIVGLVIACALPVCILIFWNKPAVKAAFGDGGALPPQQPGGYPPYGGNPPPPGFSQ